MENQPLSVQSQHCFQLHSWGVGPPSPPRSPLTRQRGPSESLLPSWGASSICIHSFNCLPGPLFPKGRIYIQRVLISLQWGAKTCQIRCRLLVTHEMSKTSSLTFVFPLFLFSKKPHLSCTPGGCCEFELIWGFQIKIAAIQQFISPCEEHLRSADSSCAGTCFSPKPAQLTSLGISLTLMSSLWVLTLLFAGLRTPRAGNRILTCISWEVNWILWANAISSKPRPAAVIFMLWFKNIQLRMSLGG